MERFSDGVWRVQFTDERHERIVVADELLAALLQAYEAVKVPDGEYRALGTNGQLDWFGRDPHTKYQLPPRQAAGRQT